MRPLTWTEWLRARAQLPAPRRLGPPALLLALAILAWQGVASLHSVDNLTLASPVETWHSLVRDRSLLFGAGWVDEPHQAPHPACQCGIYAYHAPPRQIELLVTEIVVFIEVVAEQFEFARESRRTVVGQTSGHLRKVYTANHQFQRGRKSGLIVFAVARHVAITRIGGAGIAHERVGPYTLHIPVETIARPGALMIRNVSIRNDIARIGHGYVSEKKYGFDVGRIRAVLGFDALFDADDRVHA